MREKDFISLLGGVERDNDGKVPPAARLGHRHRLVLAGRGRPCRHHALDGKDGRRESAAGGRQGQRRDGGARGR